MPDRASRRRQWNVADEDAERPAQPRHGLALDPNAWLASLKADVAVASNSAAPTVAQAAPIPEDLQALISALVRRVAWGGDRRRGSARIELSEGPLAGATLTVHTEAREVRVELDLPSGMAGAGDWSERIVRRLEERGFVADVRAG